jgi:cytidylate kinase
LVDTGAIYRCVALLASRQRVALDDDAALEPLLARAQISFQVVGDENRVFLAGEDVSASIRAPDMSMGASKVSGRPVVREGLLGLQRRLALEASSGAILEGRDIGTVVFPDADVKFFLEADPAVRARRRFDELRAKGGQATLEEVLADQTRRDLADSSRAVAPLKPAADSVPVNSSSLTLDQVVERLEEQVRARIPR